MGEWYPFFLVDRITYGAAGTGTLELTVGATEEFEGASIHFIVSSGSFNIVSIKDSSGKPYTDADSNNPIPNALFTTTMSQNSEIQEFMVPLHLAPNTTLFIETSGGTSGETLDCIIKGRKKSL